MYKLPHVDGCLDCFPLFRPQSSSTCLIRFNVITSSMDGYDSPHFVTFCAKKIAIGKTDLVQCKMHSWLSPFIEVIISSLSRIDMTPLIW